MINVTEQFIKAVQALYEKGIAYDQICKTTEIDRRNLMRLIKNPDHHSPRPDWLNKICELYHVSPDFLILNKGDIFK